MEKKNQQRETWVGYRPSVMPAKKKNKKHERKEGKRICRNTMKGRKTNMIRKESDGKHFDPNTGKREPVYCPVNGWDCPYYENGICYIRDPMEDCDNWGMFWESWEEWENAY